MTTETRKRYLFLDCETGGLDTNYSLLTVYGVILDNLVDEVGEIDLSIKPNNGKYKVAEQAMKVNRINLEQHDKQAITESEAGKRLLDLLEVASEGGRHKVVVVGHNVGFDLDFIKSKLVKPKDFDRFVSKIYIDTCQIGMFMKMIGLLPLELPNSLDSYGEYFCIKRKNLHDARNDVKLNISVFRKMIMLTLNNKQ